MKRIALLFIACITLFSCQNKTQCNDGPIVKTDSTISKTIAVKKPVIQNGEQIDRYPNGVVQIQGVMKNGKRDGVWKSFYESGAKWSETTFANGKKNGKTTTWYPNEKMRYEGFYTNDAESGNWTFWNEKGDVVNRKEYDSK